MFSRNKAENKRALVQNTDEDIEMRDDKTNQYNSAPPPSVFNFLSTKTADQVEATASRSKSKQAIVGKGSLQTVASNQTSLLPWIIPKTNKGELFGKKMEAAVGDTQVFSTDHVKTDEEMIKVLYVKLTDSAIVPQRMTAESAGSDLFSVVDVTIPPLSRELVSTGLMIKLPANCYGRIAPRSGLSYQYFVDVGAGVIDRDFRGCVSVLLFNFGKTPFRVSKGDRIAQLIIEKSYTPYFCEANLMEKTTRSEFGFGSSGRR